VKTLRTYYRSTRSVSHPHSQTAKAKRKHYSQTACIRCNLATLQIMYATPAPRSPCSARARAPPTPHPPPLIIRAGLNTFSAEVTWPHKHTRKTNSSNCYGYGVGHVKAPTTPYPPPGGQSRHALMQCNSINKTYLDSSLSTRSPIAPPPAPPTPPAFTNSLAPTSPNRPTGSLSRHVLQPCHSINKIYLDNSFSLRSPISPATRSANSPRLHTLWHSPPTQYHESRRRHATANPISPQVRRSGSVPPSDFEMSVVVLMCARTSMARWNVVAKPAPLPFLPNVRPTFRLKNCNPGAGERCDRNPSRRTGGGRVRSRVRVSLNNIY